MYEAGLFIYNVPLRRRVMIEDPIDEPELESDALRSILICSINRSVMLIFVNYVFKKSYCLQAENFKSMNGLINYHECT